MVDFKDSNPSIKNQNLKREVYNLENLDTTAVSYHKKYSIDDTIEQ